MKQKVKIRNMTDFPYRVNLSTWDAKGMKKNSVIFVPLSTNIPGSQPGVTELSKSVWNKIKEDPRIARKLGTELVEL